MLAKSAKRPTIRMKSRFTDAEGPLRNVNQTFADMLYKHFLHLRIYTMAVILHPSPLRKPARNAML